MKPKKKKRVYVEDLKTQHTTHWDLDYLSRAELDALYAENRRKSGGVRTPSRFSRRALLVAILITASVTMLAAIVLLMIR